MTLAVRGTVTTDLLLIAMGSSLIVRIGTSIHGKAEAQATRFRRSVLTLETLIPIPSVAPPDGFLMVRCALMVVRYQMTRAGFPLRMPLEISDIRKI